MLNFRNTNIFFVSLFIILIVFDLFYTLSWFYYLIAAIIYLLVLFYGSYYIQSQFYLHAICKADTKEKKIALSFDDGPLENHTPKILEILKEHGVKATFFCIGKNISVQPGLFKEIHKQGHAIGSHSYGHGFGFDFLSAKKMKSDLQRAHQLIRKELNVEIRWFRPPYGVTNPNIKKVVRQMNYSVIGWDVRSMDTIIRNPKKLLARLKRALKPGSIFLFHDSALVTVNILPEFLTFISEQDYEIVPLQNLISLQTYADR